MRKINKSDLPVAAAPLACPQGAYSRGTLRVEEALLFGANGTTAAPITFEANETVPVVVQIAPINENRRALVFHPSFVRAVSLFCTKCSRPSAYMPRLCC